MFTDLAKPRNYKNFCILCVFRTKRTKVTHEVVDISITNIIVLTEDKFKTHNLF